MNALLCNEAGERQLRLDPGCKQLIVDFERVHWKTDTHGNAQADIDKSERARTHLSAALGYMIATEFNMEGTYGRGRAILLTGSIRATAGRDPSVSKISLALFCNRRDECDDRK